MNTNDLQQIMTKLDRIEQLLTETKGKPRKFKRETSRDLTQTRVATVERFFWNLINSPDTTRRNTYKFPSYLIETVVQPHIEAMSLSVLVNQVALRKPFQTRAEGDPVDATPQTLARLAVEASNLIILEVSDTSLDIHSDTRLAMSPGEALRLAKADAPLPRVFRGWSCEERAIGHKGPLGYIEPPQDPCGPRNWAQADSGVKVVRKGKSRTGVLKDDPVEEVKPDFFAIQAAKNLAGAEEYEDEEIDGELSDEDVFVPSEDDELEETPKERKSWEFKL